MSGGKPHRGKEGLLEMEPVKDRCDGEEGEPETAP